MNEYEIINSMAHKKDTSVELARKDYEAILTCITEELAKGGSVKIVDFGVFEVAQRAARKGFQPYYRREMVIPACKEPVFKPGKALKEIIKEDNL